MAADAPFRVLVIEDDEGARHNLRDILELDDYAVQTAASAREALDREGWGQLGAIILDRRLPDGLAEDLIPHFRTLAPETALIIVTGFADLESAISAMRQGATDYLLKPINPDL